jgi:hypothetical protein
MVLSFGYNISFKYIDRGLIEVLGPLGITRTMQARIQNVSRIQTGFVDHYIFVMIATTALILFPIAFMNQSVIEILSSYFNMNNVFDYFFVNILDIFKSQYVILDSLLI